jgi:glycine oxidase
MTTSPTQSPDVVIIGGGVMGSSVAWHLRKEKLGVVVLERSVPGAEASSAAAGMLAGHLDSKQPGKESNLFLQGLAEYPEFVKEIQELTGIDVGYRRRGSVRIATTQVMWEQLREQVAWQVSCGLQVQFLEQEQLREQVPSVSPQAVGALYWPEDGQVEPPCLLRALQIAAQKAGVVYQGGTQVRRVVVEQGRARGVVLEDGTTIHAQHVVLAAGSWSSLVEGVPLENAEIRPVRGQILELELSAPIFSQVLEGPGVYLIARDDGRVLVGSTLEFVGYVKKVTAKAVRDLLHAAMELVPGIEHAGMRGWWSNFRPFAQRGLPWLGASQLPGLFLATGHHRNGILLAPLTGKLVAASVVGRAMEVANHTKSQ